MKLITIKTDNAAFEDSLEIFRILYALAGKFEFETNEKHIALKDANGNTIGGCWDVPTQTIAFDINTEHHLFVGENTTD